VRCPERTRTVALFWSIVSSVLLVFLILLFARFVVDWVMVLARSWRPSGLVAAGLEVVYTTTDPPLKAVRRVIPPLNLGSIRLDLGFMVLLIAVLLLRSFATRLAIDAS
jgi:YggT family protein